MAKRFTDTEKWKHPWFRRLPPKWKALWLYMVDQCDSVGVWYFDLETAAFHIGDIFEETEFFTVFCDKVVVLNKNTLWINGFIDFQYGNLSPKNKAQYGIIKNIIKLTEKIELVGESKRLVESFRDSLGVSKGSSRVVEGLQAPQDTVTDTVMVMDTVMVTDTEKKEEIEEDSAIPVGILNTIKVSMQYPDHIIEEVRKDAWLKYQASDKPDKSWKRFVANYFLHEKEKIRDLITGKASPPKTNLKGNQDAQAMSSKIFDEVIKAGSHGLKELLMSYRGKSESLAVERFGRASEILSCTDFESTAIKKRLREACEYALELKRDAS